MENKFVITLRLRVGILERIVTKVESEPEDGVY